MTPATGCNPLSASPAFHPDGSLSKEELRALILQELTPVVDRIIELAQQEMSSHHKGAAWELRFIDLARDRGLDVRRSQQSEGRHDLWVAGVKVQCKHIDDIKGGCVDIDNMRPVKSQDNERGYRVGEYEVLALQCRGDIYLVPANELEDPNRPGFLRSKLRLENHQHAIGNWGVFDGQGKAPNNWLF